MMFILEFLISQAKSLKGSIFTLRTAGYEYRRVRFGHFGVLVYYGRLVDTFELEKMHWNINHWTDEQVCAWRNSYVATCNAVSVAGAIFATVGVNVLHLPNMFDVHWTARACCVVSMLLGMLAVVMSCYQQQKFSMLIDPSLIRLSLSRGRPVKSNHHHHKRALDSPDETFGQDEQTWRDRDRYDTLDPFKGLPLESSIPVLKAISLPRRLLNMAVLVYMIGFGLYLVFLYGMYDSNNGHLNVFWVYVAVALAFCYYVYVFVTANALIEGAKKTQEFNLQCFTSRKYQAALQDLKTELEGLQNLQNVQNPTSAAAAAAAISSSPPSLTESTAERPAGTSAGKSTQTNTDHSQIHYDYKDHFSQPNSSPEVTTVNQPQQESEVNDRRQTNQTYTIRASALQI